MALPFVLHMLRVYYAMLAPRPLRPATTYVSNDDDIMCDGRVENECSADCGLARLIARVSVANE